MFRQHSTAIHADLDRFVSEQNVTLYRKLLDTSMDADQRRAILAILAEEAAKLREHRSPCG